MNLVKHKIKNGFSAGFAVLFVASLLIANMPSNLAFAATTNSYDFNASDKATLLSSSFNEGTDANLFAYTDDQGLNGTGAIDVQNKGTMWTAKNSLAFTAGDSYEVRGYFYNAQNDGYGGIGLSPTSTHNLDVSSYPQASNGIGVVFHGGGGWLYNNGSVAKSFSWTGGDIADNAWSYMHLSIAPRGSNQFDAHFEIYPSDSSGVVSTLKTEHTVYGLTNANLGAVAESYAYFGASNSRFSYVDNFEFGVGESTIPAAPVYFPGTGTGEDPYRISTCQQLQDIHQLEDTTGKFFVLQNNIPCSETASWNEGYGFLPIGTDTIPFKGNFDGSGFTIQDVRISRPNNESVGLFSAIEGANIHDFSISGNVWGGQNVGAVVGVANYDYDAEQSSIVVNIDSTADVTGTDNFIGGVIGYSSGDEFDYNTISGCKSSGTVQGYSAVGGIVGDTSYVDVYHNYSSGNALAEWSDAGGIIGASGRSAIFENASISSATVGSVNAGGLVGGSFQDTIYDNFARGNATADEQRAGGLIGLMIQTYIANSYATGDATASREAGGLAGIFQYYEDTGHSSIINSFSTGSAFPTGDMQETINGFVGNMEHDTWEEGDFTNDFFNRENNNECAVVNNFAAVEVDACTGVYMSEQTNRFQAESETPFTVDSAPVWNFTDTWKTQDGTYPCLRNLPISCDPEVIPHNAADLVSAQDGAPISIEETGCDNIDTFTSQKESALAQQDVGYDYPSGLVNFQLSGCPVGGSATIALSFFGTYDPQKVVVRKYNANTKTFTTLSNNTPGMTVSATTVEGRPAYRISYSITDGSSLDQDGTQNGTIVDPIGIAASVVAVPNTGINND